MVVAANIAADNAALRAGNVAGETWIRDQWANPPAAGQRAAVHGAPRDYTQHTLDVGDTRLPDTLPQLASRFGEVEARRLVLIRPFVGDALVDRLLEEHEAANHPDFGTVCHAERLHEPDWWCGGPGIGGASDTDNKHVKIWRRLKAQHQTIAAYEAALWRAIDEEGLDYSVIARLRPRVRKPAMKWHEEQVGHAGTTT